MHLWITFGKETISWETNTLVILVKWEKKLNQKLIPVYSEILFGDKKKWGTGKCYNTDEPQKTLL